MPELSVSKKTIGKLFSEMQERKFIIPDFQRPYKWDIDKCGTLWEDIVNFSTTEARNDADYFLGTIVSYPDKDKNRNLEIIDGQQRITSLLLLLRAFYKKLESMEEDEDVIGLKNQIAPCIWDINPISQKITDMKKIRIVSRVVIESDNDVFHAILETGTSQSDAKDNYSVNYSFFKKKCDEYAEANPMHWKQLCITILQKCIILPIECDTPETALTIFSTLNDRGLPLSDSDIFKAKIFHGYQSESERKLFTNTWKELTTLCSEANMSIDDVFRYYTHVLRARDNDKSKEVGLRKFYAKDNYYKLNDCDLLNEIMLMANFWHYVNTGKEPSEDINYTISVEARKHLQCLSLYPNEFWKYATSVFFMKYHMDKSFEDRFATFLAKLMSFLFTKFIQVPAVNTIKDDIYAACISIQQDGTLLAKYPFNQDELSDLISNKLPIRISRAILLLDAYLNPQQTTLIPTDFEVEHIFPKKWQNTNYNGWNYADAEEFLDRIGNKIAFEKKLNIQAGNGYFGEKKSRYAASSIAGVVALSNYEKDDWLKDDILSRENQMKKRLLSFFERNMID